MLLAPEARGRRRKQYRQKYTCLSPIFRLISPQRGNLIWTRET